MFEIETAAKRHAAAFVAATALLVGLMLPAAAQDLSMPAAGEPDTVIDFSAPAEEDDLIDAARPFVAPLPEARPVRRAAERRPETRRRHEPEFRTFDTAEGEEGQYWYHRTRRPDRIERRNSFTIVTLRTRRAAVPEVTLVPAGTAYSSEAGLAAGYADPSVIDVETERLDRRPYGPDGLDIVHRGGAKIIRIAPDR